MSVLVAFSATACSQPANIESGAVSQEYPVTVNEVTLNAKPQKVAVLSGSLADVVLAMGYETSLSLASDDCTQPDLQVLPKVSATDTQSVISAGVDLVLAETMDDSEKQTLENAGITVLLLTRAKNREDFERLYAQVGTALNGGSTGYNVGVKAAQKIFSSLDDLSRLAPESNTVVTACYISDVNGSAVTGDELGSVMMSYIGLTNIFKGLTGGTFTFDDLRLSDPTMIFCSEDVRGQIMQDAQYANLSAVKNGRVYAVDPNYMNWQGKTVYNACIDMMGLAYPELTEENSAALELDSELSETEATASPSPAPEYTAIESGTEGDDVFAMQQRLAELGYLTVEYTGMYGEVTMEAVKAFQKANGLTATGEADAETLTVLYSAEAKAADGAEATATPEPESETSTAEGTVTIHEDAPLNQIAANMEIQKTLCHGAPFYVLGPIVTDIAPGYDHITSAIGGTVAAMNGASFLCYVTPAEHLRLPDVDDVKEGIIAARIAAHAADIAKGVPHAMDWDNEMAVARKKLDWNAMFDLAIDPEKARRYRESSRPEKEDTCSMCGNFCAVKNMNRILDGEIVSIFDE